MSASSSNAGRSPAIWLLLGLLFCEYFALGFLSYLDALGLDGVGASTPESQFEIWFEATNGVVAIGLLSSIFLAIAGISNAVSTEGGEMATGKLAYRLIGYFWLVLKAMVLADALFEILIWPMDWVLAGVCSWTMLITAKQLAQFIYTRGKPESTQRLWKLEASILATLSIAACTAGYITAPYLNLVGVGQWVDTHLLY
ncbi:MAG: hypothetical protein AAGA67_05570 [Cyanobacteria bacterium P01_F01_bin.153]